MTIFDQIAKIKADIAALPAEYRALVTKAGTWEQGHVALAMTCAGAFGYVLHMLLRFPF